MSTIIGDAVVRVGQELVLDPQEGGYRTREVWRGSKSQMLSLQTSFSAVGLRSVVIEDSGRPSLQVDIPAPPEGGDAEVPVEKWTFNKDYVQESLWANKKIMDLLESLRVRLQVAADSASLGLTVTFSNVLAGVRRDCENALKGLTADAPLQGPGLPVSTSSPTYSEVSKGPLQPAEAGFSGVPEVDAIYKLLLLGADSYEVERLVITRSRSYSVQYWYGAGGVVFDESPKVYSTTGLIDTENIPSYVGAQLPQPPTSKPENTEWAWKVRKDSSEISSNGKVEETRDWVFAPWSTLLYEYVA